ncbi:hypothetical protein ED28_16265 [[Pantoea] beijingensis]|uniref:DspFAvrF family protein n=1 Tax=[Pantoea] beijingensis TaxID=1324864 RepID=A0A443IAB9_9GAMM|nr:MULTISPECIES: type III secretion system chaperone [Erwiniaceae]RWR01003.1 hypothetical protein ED28_16265 [[Pantoea] beijingensis]
MNESAHLQNLLSHYGRRLNTSLRLENGTCALFTAQKQEAAIIELPPASDVVVLHCQVMALRHDASASLLRSLLTLNFEMDAMRGCWLALEEENLRLCTQQKLSSLDNHSFIILLDGFIQQANDVQSFLREYVRTLLS